MYDTCIQASLEIDLERKKSQDLGENRTHNLHNSGVIIPLLSFISIPPLPQGGGGARVSESGSRFGDVRDQLL